MQTWINNFVRSVRPLQTSLDDATRRSEYMIKKLSGFIDNAEGLEIARIFIGGSNATHTTVRKSQSSEFDVDVHFYLKGRNVKNKNLRSFLNSKLLKIYPTKNPKDLKITKSSVMIQFRSGHRFNIDAVPVVHDTSRKGWWGYIPRPGGEQLWTSVPKHIEWVRSKTENSNAPVKFNRMVKLMKWWSKYHELKANSFAITILTGNCFNQQTFSDQWYDALSQVFKYYHTTWVDGDSDQVDPVKIGDPVNPDNNAANSWIKSDLNTFKAKAKEAEELLEQAYGHYQSGENDDAIQCLYMIFGSEFVNNLN